MLFLTEIKREISNLGYKRRGNRMAMTGYTLDMGIGISEKVRGQEARFWGIRNQFREARDYTGIQEGWQAYL